MKCTDLYNLYRELDALELSELAKAVQAYGGKYVFEIDEDDDDDNRPVISAYTHYNDHAEDFRVDTILVDERGCVTILGVAVDGGWDAVEITPMHGMISYITSEIPDTDDVKDVTTYQKISTFLGEVANSIWQNIDFDSEASVKEARERLSSYNFGDGFYGFTQRQFTTMMELEAYKQGLNDACGWMEYNYITNEMVDKLNVKSDDK